MGSGRSGLPSTTETHLSSLVEAAKESFRDDLVSIMLFGSGAEGTMRLTSDLNLLIVLNRFDKDRAESFREPLRLAHVAARAAAMFVLKDELAGAAEAFAVKFDDILRRRRVLYGDDVIGGLSISRQARLQGLSQMLLNLVMRLREQYVVVGLREEQLAGVIAEFAGPLRAAAATLTELENGRSLSPREAFAEVARATGATRLDETLEHISEARQAKKLPPGAATTVIFQMMSIGQEMHRRAERMV
jgi:predicted nucleotidyltransferase